MQNILIILFSVILIDNFVLSKFLGICPFLGVSKNIKSSVGMSLAVIFVMLLSTCVTYPVYKFLLVPLKLQYLQTMAFILVIATFVGLVEITLKKYIPSLYKTLGIYLPLITTNCAVLGVTILNVTNEYNFIESLANSLGAGLGFMLAMVLFSGVRMKLENATIIKSFRGLPITLIAASLVSLSFMGFGGVIEGIFK